jgi:hypothetical protein
MAPIRGSSLSVCFVAVTLIMLGTATAKDADATYTVKTKMAIVGNIQLQIAIGAVPPTTVPVHVSITDNTTTIAASIAAAIGNGATAVGQKVTVPARTANGKSISVGVVNQRIVKLVLNTEGFGLGSLPAGTLFFASNPISGQDTLDSNALITAGFASGLSVHPGTS